MQFNIKRKIQVRQAAVRVLPWVACTLAFTPVCAAVTSIACGVESTGPFLWSLLLVVPTGALFLASEYLKYFWQYILAALAVIGAVFLVSGNWAAVVWLVLIAAVKLAGRSGEEQTPTFLDEPHIVCAVIFPIAFLYAGVAVDPFLQTGSVILLVAFIVVNFMFRGLERLNRYIDINENMADFPGKRIGKSGTALFCAGSLIFLAVVVPLLAYNFRFIPFHIDTSKNNFNITIPDTQSSQEPAAGQADWMAAMDEEMGEPSPVLEFLGKAVMAAAVVFIVFLVFYGIYKLSRNFRRTVEEKNDVIEYSRDVSEPVERRVKAEKLRLFDTSPSAYVRKKYVKAVKKSKKSVPEGWRCPKEIEELAEINDGALHSLYEKARYSQGGCTEEDKSLIQRGGRS